MRNKQKAWRLGMARVRKAVADLKPFEGMTAHKKVATVVGMAIRNKDTAPVKHNPTAVLVPSYVAPRRRSIEHPSLLQVASEEAIANGFYTEPDDLDRELAATVGA